MTPCTQILLVAAVTTLLAPPALAAPPPGATPPPAGAPAAVVDHSPWSRILAAHVDDAGRVAYRRLRADDEGTLDAYLAALAAADPQALPQEERIAFWINAYNAVIVRAVLDGHTAESFLGRRRMFRWYTQPVAGAARSPDAIEERLRRDFDEPRIHFAIVCASSSCPRLRRRAYDGATLDAELTAATRAFLADPARNVIDPGRRVVRLSQIFDWFAADFVAAAGSVPAFAARFVPPPQAALLTAADVALEHLPYDWTLNAQPNERP
jgi:hypothetical protein